MLLINPVHSWWWTTPNLGIAYLAATLEEEGEEIKVIDCQVTKNYKQRIIEAIRFHSLVGISINIGTISSGLEIAKLIRTKSPKTKIVMGGAHPTAIYDKLIPLYADIVVLGEGEDTIVELARFGDLSTINGIAYWNDSLKVNPSRPLITDLDRLKYPAWHLFDIKRYNFGSVQMPFAFIMTSRGCPFQCIYCTKFVHGSELRLRSLNNIVGEIDYLVNRFKIKEIHIADDNFTFYPERVKQLCNLIINRKYRNLRFALTSGIRADFADPEMIELLAQAGVYSIYVGVDSSVQEFQEKLGRKLELKMVRETVKNIKKFGMQVSLFFMIGLPFETLDTMRKTIELAKILPVDQALFSIAIPFPGTEFYNIVREKGEFLQDLVMSSVNYSIGKAVYEMEGLKAKDVEKMYRTAHREFYFRPVQIWRGVTRKIRSPISFLRLLKYWCWLLFKGGQI